jgi:hypothetical protein
LENSDNIDEKYDKKLVDIDTEQSKKERIEIKINKQ